MLNQSMNKYEILKDTIARSRSIVVFTGAGISVPSGIPDFRSASGIYNQKTKFNAPPEEIISHSFFMKYTKEFLIKAMDFWKKKPIWKMKVINVGVEEPNDMNLYSYDKIMNIKH